MVDLSYFMKRVLSLALILLVSVSMIYAAGGSTGGTSSGTNWNNGTSNSTNSSNNTNGSENNRKVDCEDKLTLRERIKCRFENKDNLVELPDTIPEPCRNAERRAACVALYRESAACYKIDDSVERKGCFLRKSGVLQGGTLRSANSETKRDYVILLLYELQERVEGFVDSGKMTVDEGTAIVEKIVLIKEDILAGKKRTEIMPDIRELKSLYFEAVQ